MQHSHGCRLSPNSSSEAAALSLIPSELKGMPSAEIIAMFHPSSCHPFQTQPLARGFSLYFCNSLFKVGKINDSIKKIAPEELVFGTGVRTV